jgi:sarcosine dehydrogenase
VSNNFSGYHLWGFDLRSDDTPVEANLGFVCRKDSHPFKGKDVVLEQQNSGTRKRLVYLTLRERMPLWGLEAVYRDNEIVGHLRRGEWAYTLDCALGQCYIKRADKAIDIDYIKKGRYQIEVMGKLYDADIHLRSPFDPKGRRILGEYKS